MSKVERGAAAWQRFRCLPLLSCPHPACPRQPPEDLSQDLPSRGLFPKRLIGVTVLAGTLCALLLQPQQLLAVGIPCSSPGRCVQGARAAPEHSQRPGVPAPTPNSSGRRPHCDSRGFQDPTGRQTAQSSAFPPLRKQKSSDSRSSVPAWGSALQSLSARRGSLSLCVSHGRGGWGRSQNDSHMPRVTGAGEFCRPMPCSNPGSALPPRRCFL